MEKEKKIEKMAQKGKKQNVKRQKKTTRKIRNKNYEIFRKK